MVHQSGLFKKIIYHAIIVFVCDVQHLGNVFICLNVDEAFCLLAGPS